jgi:hypothetical protein
MISALTHAPQSAFKHVLSAASPYIRKVQYSRDEIVVYNTFLHGKETAKPSIGVNLLFLSDGNIPCNKAAECSNTYSVNTLLCLQASRV